MQMPRHCYVKDSSDPGAARRLAATVCQSLGFDDVRTAEVLMVVTELATNLVRHTAGAGGELIFSPMEQAGVSCINILALDRGPGITRIGELFRERAEGSGDEVGSELSILPGSGLGVGLGAVGRASSVFDIYSVPGHGTAVFSRLGEGEPLGSSPTARPCRLPMLDVGVVCLPVHGEQECGDAWAMQTHLDVTSILLADGLGHGPDAAIASALAVSIFEKNARCSPAELLALIHDGLRETRGAAVAVAELSLASGSLRYAGLGNISGLIVSDDKARHLVSKPGTAGQVAGNIIQFSTPWPKDGLLVLHSDGISTHWALMDYPGLSQKHPALIAGVLYRDYKNVRDDSTVIAARDHIATQPPAQILSHTLATASS